MTRTQGRLIGWVVLLALVLTACADGRAADRTQTTPLVVNVERGGFHWSDAGVGVLVGVGLSIVVFGCLALARLRDERPNSGTRGEKP